jgi:hypothetical protein
MSYGLVSTVNFQVSLSFRHNGKKHHPKGLVLHLGDFASSGAKMGGFKEAAMRSPNQLPLGRRTIQLGRPISSFPSEAFSSRFLLFDFKQKPGTLPVQTR